MVIPCTIVRISWGDEAQGEFHRHSFKGCLGTTPRTMCTLCGKEPPSWHHFLDGSLNLNGSNHYCESCLVQEILPLLFDPSCTFHTR